MEKYNLTQTGQEVQDILDNAIPQSDLESEVERAQEAERLLGEGIQQNADDIDAIEGKIPSAASSENKLTDKEYVDGLVDDEKNRAQGAEGTLQDNIDAEEDRAKAAEKQNADDIDALEAVVPSGATSENKLATESYVNDAVATSSATFRGTFNLVSDLHLTLEATHANIETALAAAIATADNNDFAFVLIPTDAETPTVIGSIERYKFNGTDWAYEYTLNNSGFTQAQWDAINSGITSGDVSKLAALPTNAQLTTLLAGLQSDIDGEEARAKAAELAIQGNIDAEETRAKAAEKQNADDIDSIEAVIPENASSENKVATESEIDSLSAAIEAILLLIPSAATSLNKLADKAYVNSSIATATATFRGTFNLVNDLHLTLAATHAQIGNALALAILDSDNNDYCFVQIPTVETAPNEIAQTDRYKFNGSTWEYEYTLNNSGFTSTQWIAINSGITSALVTKLSALPTNTDLTTALGVLTSSITAINQKIPAAAAQNNKLVDTAALEAYIIQVLDVLTVTYNVTSSDGHVTLAIQQTDGKITSVSLTTSDIASAAALDLKASQADLTALANRVTTAEGNITTLGGRVSTNETDIAQLQAAYEALTQSDIIIGALPSSGVANKIYRVPGTSSYSDYMWNGSTWVLMATYNNAIDDEPTHGSNNLVKSGGVLNSIIQNGPAFDLSAYNAVGGVLATYADLSAALTALNALDAAYKQPGMSFKFVRSSDNKYIQARCMAQNFTTDVNQWQGVDDEPTAGSQNLIESGGVKKSLLIIEGKEEITASVSSGRGTTNYDVVAGETYIILLTSKGGLNNVYLYSGDGAPYTSVETNTATEWTPTYSGVVKIYDPASKSGTPVFTIEPKESIVEPLNELFGNVESFNLFPTINALHKSLLPFNSKISIIGDSISTFTGTMPSGYVTYYPTGDVVSQHDIWWDLIMSLTHSTLDINASWTGSRVTNGRSGEGMPDFYDRTSMLGTPDYIFVALGTNDSTNSIALGDYDFNSPTADLSEVEFIPAYTKGVKSLLANYPSSKIVLYIFQMQEKYADAIRAIGNYYNIPVIDARAYYIDNVHPNKEGMAVIANSITSFYFKGVVDKVPVAGSHNTVESNGVKKCILKIEEKETVTAIVSSGRGVTNYSVFANVPYKIKLTNFGGLGNAFVYTGDGSPYTQLSLNVEIEWTPSCDGYVKIYNPSSQNGTPVFDIEPKDSIIPKVDNLLEITEKLSDEKADKDTIFSSARKFNDWVIGDISGNTGADVASTTVIRTQNYHKFDDVFKIIVTPDNNYKCGYRIYSKSGDTYTLVGGSTVATTEQFSIIVNPDYYYRFLVLYAPGGQTANVNWANNVEFFFKLKTDLSDLHIPFVNVKDFGAAGDGTTDDVSSIMLAVASCAETGGTIYFPAGVYALKTLSGNNHFLEIYPNQKFLLDKGAVIKRMTSTEGHLIRVHNASGDGGYNGSHDVEISGGTLDINGYDETNNPDGYDGFCNAITTSHCTNAIISNCVFKNQTVLGHGIGDSSWHYIEVNSSKNVFINNCFFELSNCSESIQIDSAVGHGNEGLNDNTPCKDIAISDCIFVNNGCVSVGNHDVNAHSNIRIAKCVFEGTPDSSRGYINFQPACHSIDVYENTFRNGNKGVIIQNVTDNDSTVHDNRFESVTTPHDGGIIAYNNIVNGSLVS